MKRKRTKIAAKLLVLLIIFTVAYFIYNAVSIYTYSSTYTEEGSEVAIVLGAGTSEGKVSPVFRERINHAIYLYKTQKVKKIILTGGYGQGQSKADSEVAKAYAMAQNIPAKDLLLETKSRYTIENLQQAKLLMDSKGFESALLVTDPLHSKRSMKLAESVGLTCSPSPTRSSMYKSIGPKAKSLMYESFFYSIGRVLGRY